MPPVSEPSAVASEPCWSGDSKESSGSSQTPVSSSSGAESAGLSAFAGDGVSRGSWASSCGDWATGVIGVSSVVSSLGSAGTIPVEPDTVDLGSELRGAATCEAPAVCGDCAVGASDAVGPTVGR